MNLRIKLGLGVLTILTLLYSFNSSYAQFIPIPPPGPSNQGAQQNLQDPKDFGPSVIEFLTHDLREGKNVLKVKASGPALDFVQVKMADNGKVVASKMVSDGNNIYKFLVDAKPPSKVVVIRAFNTTGGYTEAVKVYDVQSSQEFFGSIKNFFGGLLRSLPH